VVDYPLLYFINPTNSLDAKKTICVKSCPTAYALNANTDCATTSLVSTCKTTTYPSVAYLNRICVPTVLASAAVTEIKASFGIIAEMLSDVFVTKYVILASAGVAFVIAMFYMLLIRFLAGIITWLIIIALHCVLVA